jgi:hypothetical protein
MLKNSFLILFKKQFKKIVNIYWFSGLIFNCLFMLTKRQYSSHSSFPSSPTSTDSSSTHMRWSLPFITLARGQSHPLSARLKHSAEFRQFSQYLLT